ncbi:hypothetical protein ABM34_02670 [Companilactobacillus ginsenosidimutans]|uniref:Uncharacterized protein n=1 Tax=Companilactobacillus ginsenosidimutans TaxID=1007676 RepID=A0A0H4QIQ4_9LACO|nr:hypothetical protein ABM34_02670 [Companilactobacillus ginsenosidimutans]
MTKSLKFLLFIIYVCRTIIQIPISCVNWISECIQQLFSKQTLKTSKFSIKSILKYFIEFLQLAGLICLLLVLIPIYIIGFLFFCLLQYELISLMRKFIFFAIFPLLFVFPAVAAICFFIWIILCIISILHYLFTDNDDDDCDVFFFF